MSDLEYTAMKALTDTLARLEAGTLVEGRWFKGDAIIIDGYQFSRCRFDECRLMYTTLDFKFTECVLESSTIIHGYAGVLAMRAFHSPWPTLDQFWPQFAPIRHPNGTISIDSDKRNE
jgi:hypothetical protein